jgi:hypothetical protein
VSASRSSEWRRCRRATYRRFAAGAVAGALVVGAPAQARPNHHRPPRFSGLDSATTCIAGPIGAGRTSSYHLSWHAARSNVTPSGSIVYSVYQATTARGEDFSKATYTTGPGARYFDTPQLPADKAFYFVVRARDQSGNEDSNTIERQGQNLCV